MKKNILNKFIIILSIACIFIIPIDLSVFGDTNDRYVIFFIIRIIFIITSSIILIFNKNKVFVYFNSLIICILIIFKYLIYSEIDMGLLYVLAAFIISENILFNRGNTEFCDKLLNISFYGYIFQIAICSIYVLINTGNLSIVSSFNDANYTGYFLFCLGAYFYLKNIKIKAMLLFIIGLFTYSRLFIISLVIFLILIKVNKFVNINNIKKYIYTLRFYLIFQFIIIIVCVIYVRVYETTSPEYIYKEGFSRLVNMFDESNYIRCLANILALESLNPITFFIGLKKNTFEGLYLFANKSIFPHNLFWGLSIQYGWIISLIFIRKYIRVFKKIGNNMIPYYICLIIYQSFLGLSSFYGLDLVIQLLILISINKHNGGEVSEESKCFDFNRACS